MSSLRLRLPLVLLGLLLLAAGCQGRRRLEPAVASGTPGEAYQPAPRAPAPRGPAPRGGRVTLAARDLAPVDAFISARNAQWIMGDDVEVVASTEYFAPVLSVNSAVGLVQRTDAVRPDETIVTLVYLGAPGSVTVTTSPRIMIGTGLTINARRKLVLHLVKTADANVPVRLSVTATGDAVRGRKEEVFQRGPVLGLGGELRRQAQGYGWFPQR